MIDFDSKELFIQLEIALVELETQVTNGMGQRLNDFLSEMSPMSDRHIGLSWLSLSDN